jgi:hypothetical protein
VARAGVGARRLQRAAGVEAQELGADGGLAARTERARQVKARGRQWLGAVVGGVNWSRRGPAQAEEAAAVGAG